MSTHPPASALIGRLAELSSLEAHIDAAMGGSTRVVLIGGDAGIGKTRVLVELGERARRRGMIAVAGRCYSGEGADPMWPWVEALRELVEELGPSAALADLGAGAAVVATAVPAVAELLPDLPEPPPRSPGSARFRLFTAIGGFLNRAAARRPILLSLEDLHWADPPSLLLLEFVAESQRASATCIVCTYRDIEVRAGDPLIRTLAELNRSPAVHGLTLGGLSPSEVSAYVEQLIGTAPAPALLKTLIERTDGNPFFVGEVVRLLARRGGLDGTPARESGVPRVPDQVRVVIDQRLSRLSEAAQRTLSAAAAIGREFDLDILEPISRVHGDDLLAVLEESIDERIIVPLPRGGYSFAHALVRERLYERLPVSARARVHGTIANALVTSRTAGIPISAAPLAHHFVQAALPGGDEAIRLAIAYSLSAAWEATEQLAFEDAVFHHGVALRLAIRAGWGEPAQARLFLALAEAQGRAGDLALAKASFMGVTRLARRMSDPDLLARAALGYRRGVGTGFQFAPPDKDYLALLEEALAMLSSEDSALRVGLLARLGMELYFTSDPVRKRALSDEAVAMARRLAEPHVLAETLVARHLTLWSPQNVTEQLAGGREAIRLSLELADRELELQARYWLAVDLLELGDVPALDAELAAVQRLAGELSQPVYTWWTHMRLAMRTLLDGHFDEGERIADEALPLGIAAKEVNALQAHAAQIMLVRWEQGRVGELAAVATEYARRFRQSRVWESARSFIACFSGDTAAARAMLTQAVADDCASLSEDFLWLATVALLAEVAVELEDVDAAAVLRSILAPYSERWVTFGPAAACFGPVARLLGLLDMTCENWARAERQLQQAHEAALHAGSRPWMVHAKAGQALVIARRGSAGDTSIAQQLARSTRAAALTLGMVRLATQLGNLMGGAPAMGTRLTRREREVLELAIAGASAKEIATRLVISERTAESHVASIYRKLDVRSRAGLRDRARTLRERS